MTSANKRGASPFMIVLFLLLTLVGGIIVIGVSKAGFIKTAAEGYLFGYPLVITDVTRVASIDFIGPENKLFRKRTFPDANFRGVARPNVDTLYTSAFIDMDDGPFVFEMAENTERYNLMPFLDAWTNVFASLGTRTYGTGAASYLLVGPKWSGTAPGGLTVVQAPTRIVWLIGRTQTNGKSDYPLVHKIQDGIHLVTLADWQANPAPVTESVLADEIDPESRPGAVRPVAPIDQTSALSTVAFFTRLAELMADNPPAPQDAPMLARLAELGVAPGRPPQWNLLDRVCAKLGRRLADLKVAQAQKQPRSTVNGWWTPPMSLGVYGTDYPMRAVVAMVGLGANQPADAMYPNTVTDSEGRNFDGSHSYYMHFDAGSLPPVNGFWSVTAYGPDDFLIANPTDRYALGGRDPLHYNNDGSLDLYFAPTLPPDAPDSNWLPVKSGQIFLLNARLYWPKESALDGTWQLPPVIRMD